MKKDNQMENLEYDLIEWFQIKYPNIVKEMSECSHHFDENTINPYHIEGSIWTHTLMVYNYYINNYRIDSEILLACLLHDIGKPKSMTKDEENKRVRFFNHENISTILAIDILNEFEKDFFKINKQNILKLINWHSDFHYIGKIENDKFIISKKRQTSISKKYGTDKKLYYKMLVLNICDNFGRISKRNIKHDKLKFEFLKNFEIDLPNIDNWTTSEVPPIATILVGLPGSGKSTSIINTNSVIISFDNLITESYSNLNYSDAFKKALEEDKLKDLETEMFRRLEDAVKKNNDIIIDRTNLTKKSRNKILSKIPKKYFINTKVFMVGLNELNKRLKKREIEEGKSIPDDVLNSMIKNFTIPGFDERIDKIEFII
jgi:predicted kinase